MSVGVFFKPWILGLASVVALAGCGGPPSGTGTGSGEGADNGGDVLVDGGRVSPEPDAGAGPGTDSGSGSGGDSGSSETGAIEVSDAPGFDFGPSLIGTTAERWFFLRNRSAGTVTSLAVSLSGAPFTFAGGTFPGIGGMCGAELAPGASCQFAVAFHPTERGAANGTLTVRFATGLVEGAVVRTLAGKGLAPALVQATSTIVDFGALVQGRQSWRTVTLTNTGDVDATQLSARTPPAPFSFKGGYQPGTGGTCWITLAAGESCTLVLGFTASETGVAKTTLSISYEDGVAFRSIPLALVGSVVSPAFLSITDSLSDANPFDFGDVAVGAVAEHTFTVRNTGDTAASNMTPRPIGSPFDFKGGAYPGTGGTCGTTLESGASCTLIVTFAPLQEGLSHGVVTLTYDSGSGYVGGGWMSVDRNLFGSSGHPRPLGVSLR
ncbi:choice-of-anchor D domain-containing protein [Archangium violaceum]|uniref:choice-of-anchor D domain-containing protein n=1 Tax=Archangium violaceum TaxID=83451 RepID=UPI00193BF817|nr:choice-of-anchor D domain-containing protein [Archangium violaceum]QRK08943.1 choice-of-anchor D domain-containing protein [Archangium violaceum]